jgi:hypothetical protein
MAPEISPPSPNSHLYHLLQQYPPIYVWILQVVFLRIYLPDSRIHLSPMLTILRAPRLCYLYCNMIIVTIYGGVLNCEAGHYTVFVQRLLNSPLLGQNHLLTGLLSLFVR